jgi:hypothetical protein
MCLAAPQSVLTCVQSSPSQSVCAVFRLRESYTVTLAYCLGKHRYFRGLLLLAIAAICESVVSCIYFGKLEWPNPLPLFLYLSLVLLGDDGWRKLVAAALLLSSAISFAALLGLFLSPETRNGGVIFYLFFVANGIVQGYVGWGIVLHGFVRFYLLGLRMDDKLRQRVTSEDSNDEVNSLKNDRTKSTEE